MLNKPINKSIIPLVARHSEDAAFYWSQLEWTLQSPLVGITRLEHFNRLLNAHLDGIAVAGDVGWDITLNNLLRWKKPGEMFVSMHVAIKTNDKSRLDELSRLMERFPDELIRGAISALAWSGLEAGLPVLNRWSAPDATVQEQVVAIRGAALLGNFAVGRLQKELPYYLRSKNPHVCAAACRAASASETNATLIDHLRDALDASHLSVRAEASLALAEMGVEEDVLSVLLQSISALAASHGKASGALLMQTTRRLNRWVSAYAFLGCEDSEQTNELIRLLPPRLALNFILCHGRVAYLPYVAEQTFVEEHARYAGWIWQTLTGISLKDNGLTRAEKSDIKSDLRHPVTDAHQDANNGLPLPNPYAIQDASTNKFFLVDLSEPILNGQVLDNFLALELLEMAPQASRFLAAGRINRQLKNIRINTRAPILEQRNAIGTIKKLLDEERI